MEKTVIYSGLRYWENIWHRDESFSSQYIQPGSLEGPRKPQLSVTEYYYWLVGKADHEHFIQMLLLYFLVSTF